MAENTQGVPTPGRIILVTADIGLHVETFPAIVTRVDAEGIWFTAFAPGKAPNCGKVPTTHYGMAQDQWSWPPRPGFVTPQQGGRDTGGANDSRYRRAEGHEAELIKQMLLDLEGAGQLLTPWEKQFYESVSDQFTRSGSLSAKQFGTLKKIHDEKGYK